MNLTVAAQAVPVLSVSPATVSFIATQGGTDPSPATANVTNNGSGTLSFSASSDASWLSVSPSNGNAPQSLQMSAAVGALAAGMYTGHVTVTAAGAQGSPATVTVTFNVSPPPPPPTLSVSSTAVTLNGTAGSATNPSSNVTVSNSGTGTLNFDASSDASWLGASPGSGTAPQNVQLTATVGALSAGTYIGHITVTAAGAQNSPAPITVTFIVSAPSATSPLAGFFIRGNTKSQNTASTSVALGWPAFGQPQQNDLLIAYVWWNSASVTVSSVSDNCGNAWVATPAQSDSVDNAQAQLYYVARSKSCSSSPTVTVTFASAVSSRDTRAGVGVGATYYDAGGTNFQTATTIPSASVTTSHASDLLIQVVAGNRSTDTFTSGSGFTARQMGSGLALADQAVSASQTYATAWTGNVADNQLVGIFGFQLTTAAAFPVQSAFNSVTASSISCTLPQRVSAGDLLVAVLRWPNDSSVSMSASDNINGAWLPAGSQASEAVGPHSSQMFYLPNTSAGAVTVTATLSNGAAEALYVECTELTGMANTNVLDGPPATAATSGSSTAGSLTVGPVATTNNNDVLVLGCATDLGVKFVPDTGFINLQMQSREALEFASVTAPASYSQACKSGSAHYTGNLAVFRQAH